MSTGPASAEQLTPAAVEGQLLIMQRYMDQMTIMLENFNKNQPTTSTNKNNTSRTKLREPDTFSGEDCTQPAVEGWVRSIERHQTFHDWDDERTLDFAVTFLTKHADIWFRTLEQDNVAPNDWNDFKAIFLNKFQPGNSYDLARDKLVELSQTTTITDYCQQFEAIIILIPDMHKSEAYDRFMRGLKVEHDTLFAELRSVEVADRTLKGAINKAKAYEASHVRRDPTSGKVVSSPARPAPAINYHTKNEYAMDLDVLMQQNSYRGGRGGRGNRGQPSRGRGRGRGGYASGGTRTYPPCTVCNEFGHPIRSCPLFQKVLSVAMKMTGQNANSSLNALQLTNDTTNNKDIQLNQYSENVTPPVLNEIKTPVSSATEVTSSSTRSVVTSITDACNTSFTSSSSIPMELVPVINGTSTSDVNYIHQLNSISTALPLYSSLAGADNTVIKVLIDSGASDNYVSSKVVQLIATEINEVNHVREVETADGGISTIKHEAQLDLNLGGYMCKVSAFAFPMKFDLILGRTWLKEHSPVPHWYSDSWILGSGEDAVKLMPIKVPDNATGDNVAQQDYYGSGDGKRAQLSYLISKKQVNDYLRDGASGFLLYIKDTSEPISSRDVSCDNGSQWIQKLLKEFSLVFSGALPGLPDDSGFQHVINLQPDAKAVNRAPYKMSPAELDELRKQLNELLELGLIRHSTSPYGSPVLFVRKPDGSMRMCIDYRALNALTIRNSNPLPRIDECFDRLQGASYFSSLDLKSGYHQIRIQETDVPKTAFNTRYGKYEWLVLPFGLCNAPPSFQAKMNEVLGDYVDKFCLVYLDDICIYSRTLEEHQQHLQLVLKRLQENGLILNTKKCSFLKRELNFLGFTINADGILPSPSKIKAIQEWKRPSNVQEVRQFVGLAQHYRRFIPLFAAIASPLTDLTKGTGSKRRPVIWTTECQNSFDKIKSLLTSSPVLLLPDMTKPFRIETDSSDFGVGAVLLQPADNTDYSKNSSWHPIAYESKKLSSAERNYPAQERELLGVIHALRTWECFVDGCQAGYQVMTDHASLQYLRKQTKPTPRLVRWLAELESYSPEIVYKSGKTNIVPDLLSRVEGVDCVPADTSFEPKYLYALDELSKNDPPTKELSQEIQQDWPLLYQDDYYKNAKTTKLKQLLEKEKDNFVLKGENQRVFRKVKIKSDLTNQTTEDTKNGGWKVIEVPFEPFVKRADIVEDFHVGFGHAGVKNMMHMITPRHWWPSMKKDISFWIKTCSSCQVNRAKSNQHHDVMHPLDVPEAFSRWHLDFIGELPITTKGNRWIITAVDSLTNWPIAKAIPYATAEAIADFLYEEIVMRFGCPAEIITDRGSSLTSNIMKAYVHRLGTNHKLTSAFHPRTNAKVERFNGIIKPMLRKYVNGAIHRWDDFLESALFACRVRKHTTTGYSPFMLTYGREPRLPGDTLRPYIDAVNAKDPRTVADYTARELEALGQLRAAAKFRIEAVSERDKAKWDASAKQTHFEMGDMVTLNNEGGYGLEPLHKGPYVVLEYYPKYGTYKLETVQGKPLDSLIHADRLMAAYGDKPSEPWYEPSSILRRLPAGGTTSGVVSSRPMNRPLKSTGGNNGASSDTVDDITPISVLSDDSDDDELNESSEVQDDELGESEEKRKEIEKSAAPCENEDQADDDSYSGATCDDIDFASDDEEDLSDAYISSEELLDLMVDILRNEAQNTTELPRESTNSRNYAENVNISGYFTNYDENANFSVAPPLVENVENHHNINVEHVEDPNTNIVQIFVDTTTNYPINNTPLITPTTIDELQFSNPVQSVHIINEDIYDDIHDTAIHDQNNIHDEYTQNQAIHDDEDIHEVDLIHVDRDLNDSTDEEINAEMEMNTTEEENNVDMDENIVENVAEDNNVDMDENVVENVEEKNIVDEISDEDVHEVDLIHVDMDSSGDSDNDTEEHRIVSPTIITSDFDPTTQVDVVNTTTQIDMNEAIILQEVMNDVSPLNTPIAGIEPLPPTLPPRTPALRPVVTTPTVAPCIPSNANNNHHDESISITNNPIPTANNSPTSTTLPSNSRFTFIRFAPPNIIHKPDEPSTSTTAHISTPPQASTSPSQTPFRFASVPGVTQRWEGDNVEHSNRESIEDIPEFIQRWNANRRKRFRPVTPSSSTFTNSNKRRRTNKEAPAPNPRDPNK